MSNNNEPGSPDWDSQFRGRGGPLPQYSNVDSTPVRQQLRRPMSSATSDSSANKGPDSVPATTVSDLTTNSGNTDTPPRSTLRESSPSTTPSDAMLEASRKLVESSVLSPEAKEFVPRSASSSQSANNGHPSSPQDVLSQVRSTLNQLTMNPGSFDTHVHELVKTLNMYGRDEKTLRGVIDLIFQQSITETNFRYSGARLANHLSHNLQPADGVDSFRSLLLRKCQQEYQRKDYLLRNDSQYLQGFSYFLAELFTQLKIEIPNSLPQRITELGDALIPLFETLLENPESNNLKCVGQILKMCGYHLDEQESHSCGGTTPRMDALMVKLQQVAQIPGVEKLMAHMMVNVIELRAYNWGRPMRQTSVPTEVTIRDPNERIPEGPVFYSPDGQVLSAEESRYLSAGRPDSDPDEEEILNELAANYAEHGLEETEEGMDDEMHEAYEKFLQEMSNKVKH